MRIFCLKKSERVYSCNSYLILGEWNRIEDTNTVIDPGADGFILDEIERMATGFGKTPVSQIILTHNHFDHAGGVKALKERYGCRVLAFAEGPEVDEILYDGEVLAAGEGVLEVIHTPGHSTDSICLFAPVEKILFSGDTQVNVRTPDPQFAPEYREGIAKLAGKEIRSIYSGHDAPVMTGAQRLILTTLKNVTRHRKAVSRGS